MIKLSYRGALFGKQHIMMSEKRLDHCSRILRCGESRRPDARCQFKYKDNTDMQGEPTIW